LPSPELQKERFNMKLMKYSLAILALGFAASPTFAADLPTFEEIVKKAEAKFEPAKARPGQTVTIKFNVELLKGWHTYPLTQPDKGAKSQTNRLVYPTSGPIVFVGQTIDPPDAKEKSEPVLGIEQLRYYPGGGTWERKAIVVPGAQAGKLSTKIKFSLLVCDKDNCLAPKPIELEATLEVAGDPMPVDPKYKDEVEKAQKK
jgi:hypothetical protein